MANTHYKLLTSLKKQAVTSAGVSAPTAQPVVPIKPAAGMPASGPLSVGNSGANTAPSAPSTVLGGGTGLNAGTGQPTGFVAGMNQRSQEAQAEQQKALGDAQSEAQKMQQDQLDQQAKAQQDQQHIFKKDEELHRTKMELETLKAQTNAAQAASGNTPSVSPLLPTTAKRIASKANSLMKKMSSSALFMPKQAYTYKPAQPQGTTNNQYGGATSLATNSMQGPRTPTSVTQGRMYNSGVTVKPNSPSTIIAGAEQAMSKRPVSPAMAMPAVTAATPYQQEQQNMSQVIAAPSANGPTPLPTPARTYVQFGAQAPKLSWGQALQGVTERTNTPEEMARVEELYKQNPERVGQDPTYFDNRSIRTKLLRDVFEMQPPTPLELQKIHNAPWLDPGESWFKGIMPNIAPGTGFLPKKMLPAAQKLTLTALAIPDSIKNTVHRTADKSHQSAAELSKGTQSIRDTFKDPYAADAPHKLWTGIKHYGMAPVKFGDAALEIANITGIPGLGKKLLTRLATGYGAPFMAGLGIDALAPDGNSPQDLSWDDKARAMELGIRPDDPDFYTELTNKYNNYYKGKVPDSVNSELASMGAQTVPGSSTTNANTLQGTGYLHGGRVFNPMGGSVGPYQSLFMGGAFPFQPQMYQQAPFDPMSMLGAFQDSANAFGTPAYYQQYRSPNAMFTGNTF